MQAKKSENPVEYRFIITVEWWSRSESAEHVADQIGMSLVSLDGVNSIGVAVARADDV